MWIEIPDELEQYLYNIDNPMSKESLAVNALFESMLKGQHIVYASRKLLSVIQGLDYINPSTKAFARWLRQQYIYVYSCKNIIEYKIIASVDNLEITAVNKNYYVPLAYFFDFRETKLLTENETDGKFFIDIYHFIRKHKKTSDMYSIKFENDSCHGANVAAKITQNALENRIAVCLLDSDRELSGAKTGATYKGANNSYKKIKNNHIMYLSALESREKENLFPPSAYIPLCKEKIALLNVLSQFISEEKIIRYFDIKDGIKYKKYKINGWEQYYKRVIDELKKEGIYKMPESGEEDDDFVCLEGIGDKMSDIVCKAFLESEEISEKLLSSRGVGEKDKQKIQEIRKSIRDILPKYMYDEWEQIHNLLFSWGCCISEKSLPNYMI